jgi:hypothetical protein
MDIYNEAQLFFATASPSYLLFAAGALIVGYVLIQIAVDLLKKVILASWKYLIPFILFAIWFYGYHIPIYKRFLVATQHLHEQYKDQV